VWTVKTDFKRSYYKIGEFWLPESNESETKVRMFGTAVLSIDIAITKSRRLGWNNGQASCRSTGSNSGRTVLKNLDVRHIRGSVLLPIITESSQHIVPGVQSCNLTLVGVGWGPSAMPGGTRTRKQSADYPLFSFLNPVESPVIKEKMRAD
jgi:hypothetical protein